MSGATNSDGASVGGRTLDKPSRSRDPNLDFIRATAIILVLVYHICALWPVENKLVRQYSNLGLYGVDLFFVLSGWLIGRLYWIERYKFGDVRIIRFWLRRALRTMPPYFIALAIIWSAVTLNRGEPIDLRYLVFLQNYVVEMPFFLASWSLCVEEHFYLTVPLLIPLFRAARLPLALMLPVLVCIPPIFRLVDPFAYPGQAFGYAETATHLRTSGIALGLWCAWLSVNSPLTWARIRAVSQTLVIPALGLFLTVAWWPNWAIYYVGPEFVAIIFACVLAAVVGGTPLPLAESAWIHRLAVWSYSIYLTHGLVIHGCGFLKQRFSALPEPIHLILWCASILVVGACFCWIIEDNSIKIRDLLVARRV